MANTRPFPDRAHARSLILVALCGLSQYFRYRVAVHEGDECERHPGKFEAALRFLTTYYTPVRLQDVLTDCDGRGLPPRAVLVTFDDAYVSVADLAAPLCRKYGVPAVFFVNAAFLDNRRLAPDNLVCYVATVFGMKTIPISQRGPSVGRRGSRSCNSLLPRFSRVSFRPSHWPKGKSFLTRCGNIRGIKVRVAWRRGSGPVLDQQTASRTCEFRFRDRESHLQSCALQIPLARGVWPRGRQE